MREQHEAASDGLGRMESAFADLEKALINQLSLTSERVHDKRGFIST